MGKLAKLVIGLLATILLTYASFYMRGNGERTLNTLTAKANQALVSQGILGVTVAFEAAPARRVAHLEGDLPPIEQARALQVVQNMPGVAEAVWGPAQ